MARAVNTDGGRTMLANALVKDAGAHLKGIAWITVDTPLAPVFVTITTRASSTVIAGTEIFLTLTIWIKKIAHVTHVAEGHAISRTITTTGRVPILTVTLIFLTGPILEEITLITAVTDRHTINGAIKAFRRLSI